MTDDPLIPPATQKKLAEDFPPGTRHQAKMDIALPLIGNRMAPTSVFQILRDKFPDAQDSEINSVIDWCIKANPAPTEYKSNGNGHHDYSGRTNGRYERTESKPEKPKRAPSEQCDWWTNGSRVSPDVMAASSPVQIPQDMIEAGALAIGSLYPDTDLINIVLQFIDDGKKAKPHGSGKILPRDQWVEWFQTRGVPQSQAGAWMRINPTTGFGSGKEGAITDDDITDYRYLLVESDAVSIPQQLAFLQRLKLPIAAMIMSGSLSVHAWIKLESPDANNYDETAKRILANLEPFGVDKANKNPSRLCRVPGATRTLYATGDGLQRLLFLNPTVAPLSDEALKRFEESLEFPAIEERPLYHIARDSIARYEDLRANVGKLGVPYGIPKLDYLSGGMKPGQTIVIAGETGGGKSTMALHTVQAALNAGHGVALFSLEMDREEVFDLIMSNRCDIDRNKFNHGRFSDFDLQQMAEHIPGIARLPLYIEDSALSSADQIRVRTLQLKAAGKLGLVVVDYIQFVNPGMTKENREQQIAGISHTLRALARETKLPMLILSQLNDEGRLRESRVIAHNANVVMLITLEKHESIETCKVKIIKGRGIPKGEYALDFNSRFGRLAGEPFAAEPQERETQSPSADP